MPSESENTPRKRGIIYPHDIRQMTGMSDHATWRLLRKIRKTFGKPAGSLVKIEEFCACTGLDEEFVMQFVR